MAFFRQSNACYFPTGARKRRLAGAFLLAVVTAAIGQSPQTKEEASLTELWLGASDALSKRESYYYGDSFPPSGPGVRTYFEGQEPNYRFVRQLVGRKITDDPALEFDIGEKNVNRAVEAVLQDDTPEGNLVGGLLLIKGGPGVVTNPEEGFARLKVCIEKSTQNPELQREAQFEVGAALFFGRGTSQQKQEGLRWIRHAAKKGHVPAAEFLRAQGEHPPNPTIQAAVKRSTAPSKTSVQPSGTASSDRSLDEFFARPKRERIERPNLWPFFLALVSGLAALAVTASVAARNGHSWRDLLKSLPRRHPWITGLTAAALLFDVSGAFARFGLSFTIPSIALVPYMLGFGLLFRVAVVGKAMGKLAGWLVPIVLYLGWVFIYAFGTAKAYGPPSFLMLFCCLAVYQIVQSKNIFASDWNSPSEQSC